jgi:hypothetical protein
MFKAALIGVLRSPGWFFDTTPMGGLTLLGIKFFLTKFNVGRILSRLSKDQDTLDTEVAMTLFQVGHVAVSMLQFLSGLSTQLLFPISFVVGTVRICVMFHDRRH